MARISGSQKLFRLDADGKKTQLTFGTQDEAAAKFLNADTIIFSSTATDPATPLTPEVARNGNIFNLWSLSLKNGELKQYTDALGGVLSPVVLSKDGAAPKLAFVDYYKGSYTLHTFDLKEPLHTAASADFGTPGPITDFQAPLQHTLVAENKSKKGMFDKMFLDGRPPVNVGVTSGGDVFGGSMVSFTDVLGDQQFSMYASSVQQYKTLSFSYLNLSRRFQFALQGYSQTQFFYGQLSQYFYDPRIAPFISRQDALATQTVRGGSMFGIYPFSTYRRVELSGGLVHFAEEYADPALQFEADRYQQEKFGTQLFNRGMMMPLGVAFIQETTVFREYGPLSGSTMRLSYEGAPKVGNSLSRQTFDGDARHYTRIGANGVFAVRAYGFKSWGSAPGYTFFGGNSEMRGYEYREFLGHKGFYLNSRAPLPAHPRHGDADRHSRRHPRRLLLQRRRRGPRRAPLQDLRRQGLRHAARHRPERRHPETEPAHLGLPPRRRARILRHRPRNLCARLPGALRLVVPDACSTRPGRTTSTAAVWISVSRGSRRGLGTTSRSCAKLESRI